MSAFKPLNDTEVEIAGITWLRVDKHWFYHDFSEAMEFDVPRGIKVNGGKDELVWVSGGKLNPIGESGNNFEARHGTRVKCSGRVVIALE